MNARELGLGEELRAMRLARGLSLAEAAFRVGLSKSTLMGWECERFRPRGAALARLLDALEAEPRHRARLLHAADPQHARIELANTALGAPVDLGAVLRAMRLRRGLTQAEFARAAGTTQATVARWESGDAVPSGENLHAAVFALGASPEEALAMACAKGEPSGELHLGLLDDQEARRAFNVRRTPDGPLGEVALLGLEAELWHRAVRDARWDPMLCGIVGARAIQYFMTGRLGEAEETARRGLRFNAATPEVRFAQTTAFSALLEVATERGADPAMLAGKIEGWTARLPDGAMKVWMRWERALRLAEMGRGDEAADLTVRAAEESDSGGRDSWSWVNARLEVEIRAGRSDRAEALLPAPVGKDLPDVARRRVRIAHVRGEAADEATMEAMRAERIAPHDWYARHKLAKIEREQVRLARSVPARGIELCGAQA